MTRQRRGFKLLALVFCVGLVAAACGSDKKSDSSGASGGGGSSSSSSGGEKKGGTLILGAEQWPDCLNPITQCANSSWMHWAVDEHVLPRLMELNEKGTFAPSPVLDGEPKLTGEGTEGGTGAFTVTYKIAADAVWDDGSPITGDDIDFTKDAYLKTTGTIGTVGYDKITSVTSTDNGKTVAVAFSEPFADWQDLWGGNSAYVLKKAAFKSTDVSQDMLDAIPFSAAPFKLQSFTKEQAIFVPNDKYWDADRKPLVDQVVMKPLADSETELNALKAGEVFAIYPQPSPGIADQLKDPNIKFEFGAGTTYEGLWLNQGSLKNPNTALKDKAVREALLFAVDRQAILDTVIKPNFPDTELLQCGGWVPTVGNWCQDDFADTKFDAAKVDTLLTGAGYAKGGDGIYAKDGQKLSISWQTVAGNKRREDIQALVVPKLKELGIELVPDNSDADTLFQTRLPHLDTEIGLYAQTASPDPSVTTIFACENIPTEANNFSGQNNIGWCNQEATDLMHKSDQTPETKAREDLIHQIGKLVRSDAAWFPFYQLPLVTAVRTDKVDGPTTLYTSAPPSAFENIYDWSVK